MATAQTQPQVIDMQRQVKGLALALALFIGVIGGYAAGRLTPATLSAESLTQATTGSVPGVPASRWSHEERPNNVVVAADANAAFRAGERQGSAENPDARPTNIRFLASEHQGSPENPNAR